MTKEKSAARTKESAAATSPNSKGLYPAEKGFQPTKATPIGGVVFGRGDITYNEGRQVITLTIRNTGDRPIQVGSHFHLFEVNRYLEFDRRAAFGYHLNIPATTAIRFEPGDERSIEAVAFAGKRRIIGFNGLTEGYAGTEDNPTYLPTEHRAIHRMHKAGFRCSCKKCNTKKE